MTTIEVRPPGGSYSAFEYGEFQIEHGTSDVTLAPTARIDSIRGADVDVGDDVRITADDGTTQFEGFVESTPIEAGQGAASLRIEAKHDAYRLFDEEIGITNPTPTDDETVLSAALSAATEGGDFTLDYAGTPTSLANAYEVDDRSVKRVFRDMVEKTGRVWWIGVDKTIHVEPRGHRGAVATVDTATDDVAVSSYDPADIDTVINDVTVTGTGDVAVSASATDANSISTYGPRSESPNYEFITSQQEAQELADALLQPVPLPSAEATLARSVADTRLPLVNYELDITDAQGTTLDDTLTIQGQTVLEGYATVELGEGAGVNIAKYNRRQKSADDKTAAGSVVDGSRIADDSVDTPQLVDTAVIEQKLADLSVSETKVQDDSIATPKLQAEAVTAGKILAGTITAGEIATGTLTANEIDTLDIDTNQLTIGQDADVQILFDVIGSGGLSVPRMYPDTDEGGILGQTSNRWSAVYSREFRGAQGVFSGDGVPLTLRANTANAMISGEVNGDTALIPNNNGTCQIGTAARKFADVYTGGIDIADGPGSAIRSESGVVGTELLPETDGENKLGNGNFQFDEIHAEGFFSDGSPIGGGGSIGDSTDAPFSIDSTSGGQNADFAEDLNGNVELDIASVDAGNIVGGFVEGNTGVVTPTLQRPANETQIELFAEDFIPQGGAQTGAIGTASTPFAEMNAGAFNTQSPEPLTGVATDHILGYSWRQPPLYATQKERQDGYERTNPAKDGIDLGHMSNYLFEVTKSQSETIQDQQDRIDDLESTVADLEARLSDLESGPNA